MEIEGHGENLVCRQRQETYSSLTAMSLDRGKECPVFRSVGAYEIRLVKGAGMNAGGLFNCSFSGDGSIALTHTVSPWSSR